MSLLANISRKAISISQARRSTDFREKGGNMDEGKQIEEIQGSILRIRGLIETLKNQTEQAATEMCANYCRHPREIQDEDLLNAICEQCPMGKLL